MLRLCLAEISATAAFTLIDLASANGWQAPFFFLPCLPFQWSWKRIPAVISKPGRDLWYTAGQWHSTGNYQFCNVVMFFKWSKRSEGWTVLIPEECTNKLETQNDWTQRWWFFFGTRRDLQSSLSEDNRSLEPCLAIYIFCLFGLYFCCLIFLCWPCC